MTDTGDAPRADMFLPDKLLAMGIVFLAGGPAFAIFGIIKPMLWAVIFGVIVIVLGIFAVLCWKNQTIHIISDEQFTYTTMFGKTHTYAFSDIQGLRKNSDSMTLFVAGEKVHIESMALLSDTLVTRINAALKKLV